MAEFPQPISENEAFITLMRVAGEDDSVREKMVGVLSLEPKSRKSFLSLIIHDMKLAGAPDDFVNAIRCFMNDAAADKALKLLMDQS
jgi:hypothetical protein